MAFGTSAPELAVSIGAAITGNADVALGNVVGSDTVNDAALRIDFPVMLAATFVLLPIVWNGFVIQRWEGAVLAVFYVAYVVYLVLDASDHDAAEVFGPAMLLVVPLMMLTFVVIGVQGVRRHRETMAV